MTGRTRQFLALAHLTAVEVVRQPVCLLLTTTALMVTATVPLLHMFQFGEAGKVAREAGLACQFLFGVFLTGYAASTAVAREIAGGTASAVLSKPVGRGLFFAAKYAGVAAVIALFSVCLGTATLLAERVSERFVNDVTGAGYVTDWRLGILLAVAPPLAYSVAAVLNFAGRRPFAASAFGWMLVFVALVFVIGAFVDRSGRFAPFDFRVEWRIVPASVLVMLALLVLGAIAISLSTRLGMVPTLSICAILFLAGLMLEQIPGMAGGDSAAGVGLRAFIPNWQNLWAADALNDGGRVSRGYMAKAGLYGVLFTTGVLCLGLLSFQRREMK